MKSRFCRLALAAAPALLLAACASAPKPLFHWGEYPDAVYGYYQDSGDWDSQEKVLTKAITEARSKNLKVGPGIYAQLGLVMAKQGRDAEAQAAFRQEAMLYPESAVFMQRLTGMKRDGKDASGAPQAPKDDAPKAGQGGSAS